MGWSKPRRRESASQAPENARPISVGTRLEIWWEAPYEMFYPGAVARIGKQGIYIVYDDGDEEWISDLSKEIYRVLPSTPLDASKSEQLEDEGVTTSSNSGSSCKEGIDPIHRDKTNTDLKGKVMMESTLDGDSSCVASGMIKEGSRIEILWDTNDNRVEYYPGTVRRIRAEQKKPYFIEYDDGDTGCYSLKREKFRLLEVVPQHCAIASAKIAPNRGNDKGQRSSMLLENENEDWLNTKQERFVTSVPIRHQLLSNAQECEQFCEELHSPRPGDEDVATGELKAAPSINHQKQQDVYPEKASPCPTSTTDTKIAIGARVEVWWPYYDSFFPGTVTRARNDGCVLIIYDDGDQKWHDLRRAKYRKLKENGQTPADNVVVGNNEPRICDDSDLVTIGSRVEIYWGKDKEYHPGTVVRKHKTQDWYYVEYDCGETISGAIDFREQLFRFIEGSKLGKRTDTDCNDTPCAPIQSYQAARVAVVAGIRDSELPHFLQYTDGEEEWVDLKQEKYRLLQNDQDAVEAPIQEASQETTRIDVYSKSPETTKENNHERPEESSDLLRLAVGSQIAVWWEDDARYHSATVKKIESGTHTNHFHLEYDGDGEYEILDLRKERFQLLQSDEQAMFLNSSAASTSSGQSEVEALQASGPPSKVQDLEKWEHNSTDEENQFVAGRHENLSAQADNSSHLLKRHSTGATDGISDGADDEGSSEQNKHIARPPLKKRRVPDVDSESNGKRNAGCDSDGTTKDITPVNTPARTVASNNGCGVAVEQIDLRTGDVVATFSSLRRANEKTGINRKTIQSVLQRKGDPDAGGFFWRRQGESHKPWESPQRTVLPQKRIEKVCLRTAKVLTTYESIAKATKALGSGKNQIQDVIDGKRASAAGFFWRPAGSDKLPQAWEQMGKQVLARRVKNGPIVREFESPLRVSELLDVDCFRVAKWCTNQVKAYGLYWSFKILPSTSE